MTGNGKRREMDLFDLNPNALDEEWVEQPRLYRACAHKLAEARQDYERAKAAQAVAVADAKLAQARAKTECELIAAEIEKDIRRRPSKYKFDENKPTVGAIEKTILLQEPYKVAADAVIIAKHKVDVAEARDPALLEAAALVHYLEGELRTLEHRKTALEKLVDLRLADYFAEPRKPRNPDEREKLGKAQRDATFGHGKKRGTE